MIVRKKNVYEYLYEYELDKLLLLLETGLQKIQLLFPTPKKRVQSQAGRGARVPGLPQIWFFLPVGQGNLLSLLFARKKTIRV